MIYGDVNYRKYTNRGDSEVEAVMLPKMFLGRSGIPFHTQATTVRVMDPTTALASTGLARRRQNEG